MHFVAGLTTPNFCLNDLYHSYFYSVTFIELQFLVFFYIYSRDSKTGHSNTGMSRIPIFFSSGIQVCDDSKTGPNGPLWLKNRSGHFHFVSISGPVFEPQRAVRLFYVVRSYENGFRMVRYSNVRFQLKVGLRIPDMSGIRIPTVLVLF